MKLTIILFLTASFNGYAVNFKPISEILNRASQYSDKDFHQKTDAEIQKIEQEIEEKRNKLQKLIDSKKQDHRTRQDKNSLNKAILKLEVEAKRQKGYFDEAYKQYRGFEMGYLKDAVELKVSPEKIALLEYGVQRVLDGITKGNFDSNFFLNDIRALKTKAKINDTALLALKHNSYKNLNNTLFGEYVNGQIRKSMGNFCEIKKSCGGNPESAVNFVENVVSKILTSPETVKVDINNSNTNFKVINAPGEKAKEYSPKGKVIGTK